MKIKKRTSHSTVSFHSKAPLKLKKLNSPKINEPIKKWATELNKIFSKEKIQMTKST
jgi:hypothetical protein